MFRKISIIISILVLVAAVAMGAEKKFTLVIDAGHGGKDAGAVGASSKEKDINLKVALAFGRYVERNCPDVRVIYTRKTDVFLTLGERANIANKAKADLFISVHTNALPKGKIAKGFEVYTLGMHRAADNLEVAQRENSVILVESNYKQRYQGFDPNSSESYIIFEFMADKNMEKSVELARFVQQEVCARANRPNKGVHQAGFLVLRETSMPSCLIELGFITTPEEERLLNSESGIDSHARGIYNAFVKYKGKYGGKGTSTATTEDPVEAKKEEPVEDNKAGKANELGKPDKANEPQKSNETNSQKGSSAPVFKVQILTSDRILDKNSKLLKGEKKADYYKESGIYKYTVGASENYNEILQLHKTLLPKFKDAFIIAFKDGKKMNVSEAIREYKKNKNK